MKCEQVRRLIDNYLENQLGQYDRRQLESHMASCSSCFEEFRRQSAIDRAIGQALNAAVQHQALSSEASARIVRQVQDTARPRVWPHHALLALRIMTTLVTAVLVVLGVFFLLERVPTPVGSRPITLLPVIQLALSELNPISMTPTNQPTLSESQSLSLSAGEQPALTLRKGGVRIEPPRLHPNDPFTITLILHNNLPEPVANARVDLEVSGPSGYYSFPLTVEGPLPAPGVSVLRVTPANLEAICEKQYLISPTEMFEAPGVYTVRVTLFSPVFAPRQ
jgi:hypothetical protein